MEFETVLTEDEWHLLGGVLVQMVQVVMDLAHAGVVNLDANAQNFMCSHDQYPLIRMIDLGLAEELPSVDHPLFERSAEQALQPIRDLLRNQHQLAKFNCGKDSWKASWGFRVYEILRKTNSVDFELLAKIQAIAKEGCEVARPL